MKTGLTNPWSRRGDTARYFLLWQWPRGSRAALGPMRTRQYLTATALCLWVVSLFLPTMRIDDSLMYGYELFFLGASKLYAVLFAPIHCLSWFTNLLLLWQGSRLLFLDRKPNVLWLTFALPLNVFTGLFFGTLQMNKGPFSLPGLLGLPGYYFWLSSFALLLLAVIWKVKPNPSFKRDALKRAP